MNLSVFIFAAAAFCLVLAAWSDFRNFRIPNAYPAVLLLLFVVNVALAGTGQFEWSHLWHFALALGAGMLLFALKWVGGGDAKLYAAAAIWFPLGDAPLLLASITLSGVVVVLAFWIVRKIQGGGREASKDRRIPYGIAISAGAILSAIVTLSIV